MAQEAYEGWALLEILGHRRRPGYVREVEMYGGKLLRIDIPVGDKEEDVVTEFYGTASIYCLTPCTKDVVMASVDKWNDPRPIRPVDFRPSVTNLLDAAPKGAFDE